MFYSLSLDRLVPQDDFYHKRMVSGKRQAIDSAFIKANASMDSLLEKEVVDDVAVYADELNESSEFKFSVEKKKQVRDFFFDLSLRIFEGKQSDSKIKFAENVLFEAEFLYF